MCLRNVAAISFDLDDTLWSFKHAVQRAEVVLHSWLCEHAPKTASILPGWQALSLLRSKYERSRPDLAFDYRALRVGSIYVALERAGEHTSLAESAYDVFYAARQKVEFYDDVLPALSWLAARFPLVAVTNGTADLALAGCSAFFRASLSARAFGAAKPHASIFHQAARCVSVRPDQMLHVGDDFELDVQGALSAGLQAAWLVRNQVDESDVATPGNFMAIRDLSVLCRGLASLRPDTTRVRTFEMQARTEDHRETRDISTTD